MTRSARPAGPDRRRFLKLVGFAGLTSAVGTSMMAWAQGKSPASPQSKAPPTAPADTTANKPPTISEDARALTAIIERRYGAHLDAKQLEGVTTEIENRLQSGKALRAAKLANSDEPDFVFRA